MNKKMPNATPGLQFPLHVIKKCGKESVILRDSMPFDVDNQIKITKAYEAYNVLLLKYCFLRVSNMEKAIDIVQETYIRTWQYLVKGNDIQNTKSFLFTTAQHLIIDEYRKKKSVSLDLIMNTKEEPRTISREDVYIREDIARSIYMISTLPLRYSVALSMRYLDDLSVKEIALSLKKTDTNISVTLHRGIKMLQKSFGS